MKAFGEISIQPAELRLPIPKELTASCKSHDCILYTSTIMKSSVKVQSVNGLLPEKK